MLKLSPSNIRHYYIKGFRKQQAHEEWKMLDNKQYKIRTASGHWYKLNKLRTRFNFHQLKRYCIDYAPANLYMSAMNWLMPERVGKKKHARYAYPISGEYVVDIDSHTLRKRHKHRVNQRWTCLNCIEVSKMATLEICDKIAENYNEIKVVFSGKKGYHIHVLDFDPYDWTKRGDNPVKAHEVGRYKYTLQLDRLVEGFDKYHFILSCDVMRVVSYPESLNSKTGYMCKYLGGREELQRMSVIEILETSDAKRFLYPTSFTPMSLLSP